MSKNCSMVRFGVGLSAAFLLVASSWGFRPPDDTEGASAIMTARAQKQIEYSKRIPTPTPPVDVRTQQKIGSSYTHLDLQLDPSSNSDAFIDLSQYAEYIPISSDPMTSSDSRQIAEEAKAQRAQRRTVAQTPSSVNVSEKSDWGIWMFVFVIGGVFVTWYRMREHTDKTGRVATSQPEAAKNLRPRAAMLGDYQHRSDE